MRQESGEGSAGDSPPVAGAANLLVEEGAGSQAAVEGEGEAPAVEMPNLLARQEGGEVEEAGASSAEGLVENRDEVPGQLASFAEIHPLRQAREADHWEGPSEDPAYLGEYQEFLEHEAPQLERTLGLLRQIPGLAPRVGSRLPFDARLEALQQAVDAVHKNYAFGLPMGFPKVRAKDFSEEDKADLQRGLERGRDLLVLTSAETEDVYIRVNEFLIMDNQLILAWIATLHEAGHERQYGLIARLGHPVLAARLSPYERGLAEKLAMNNREYNPPSLDAESASKGVDPRQHFRAYQEQIQERDARNFARWAAAALFGISQDDYVAMVEQKAREYTAMLKRELR